MQPLTFEILWITTGGAHDMPRVIGRDTVKRQDLSAAITAATNMLKKGKGNSDWARGFVVRNLA